MYNRKPRFQRGFLLLDYFDFVNLNYTLIFRLQRVAQL